MATASARHPGALAVEALDAFRLIRSSSGLLLDHAALTAELARLEWQEEQIRLKRMSYAVLIGLMLLNLSLLHLSLLAMVLAWHTPLLVPVAAVLTLLYTTAAFAAWRQLGRLAAPASGSPFSASLNELQTTLALLRNRL